MKQWRNVEVQHGQTQRVSFLYFIASCSEIFCSSYANKDGKHKNIEYWCPRNAESSFSFISIDERPSVFYRRIMLHVRRRVKWFHLVIYWRQKYAMTSWTIWCADPWLIPRCAAISFTVTRRFSFTMASTAAVASGVITPCAWPGRGESVTKLMPFVNFLVHSYTCCSDRHASTYWTYIGRWISMGFTPSL